MDAGLRQPLLVFRPAGVSGDILDVLGRHCPQRPDARSVADALLDVVKFDRLGTASCHRGGHPAPLEGDGAFDLSAQGLAEGGSSESAKTCQEAVHRLGTDKDVLQFNNWCAFM